MTKKIDDGGPAFAAAANEHTGWTQEGMSLRDWFASQALSGMASISLDDGDMIMGWADMAKAAYNAADAMLVARKSGGEA